MKTPEQLKQWVRSGASKRIDTQSDWQSALYSHLEWRYGLCDTFQLGVDLDGEIEHLHRLCKSGDLTESQCSNLIRLASKGSHADQMVKKLRQEHEEWKQEKRMELESMHDATGGLRRLDCIISSVAIVAVILICLASVK